MRVHRTVLFEFGEADISQWIRSAEMPRTAKLDVICRLLVMDLTTKECLSIAHRLEEYVNKCSERKKVLEDKR